MQPEEGVIDMDLGKHLEFFAPMELKENINIIGAGAIGSTIIEMLTRLGFEKIHVWDFDIVTAHNLANQMFQHSHIGKKKTDAIEEIAKQINPNIKIIKHEEYKSNLLRGYIFMCADDMDVRRDIIKTHKYNMTSIAGIFDYRMGLEEAQHYASKFQTAKDYEVLERQTAFRNEEAAKNVPRNACGMELSIISTVRTICGLGISNFINMAKGEDFKNLIQINSFNGNINLI